MTDPAPLWLPTGWTDATPGTQALILGLLTLVQEDVPTIGAALLSAAGRLPWHLAWTGVFLGIWLGDALLYLLARGLGRPLLQHRWAKRFFNPTAVARSENWFSQHGIWLLFSSRFVPGTRLPTYLAAGFLRLPFGRFLLATGTAVAVWTTGIFLLARVGGPALSSALQRWNSHAWVLIALVLILTVALRLSLRLFQQDFRRRAAAAAGRWTRWEFWPASLFYLPVVLNYLRLAVRYRGFTVPTAANPGIFSGGIVGESKIATLRDLLATSPEFTAAAHRIEGATTLERLASLRQLCATEKIDYPFILKPDVGQRGVGVKLIRSPDQTYAYLASTTAPLIVQRYAPGPHEIGVFYYRFPHEPRGRIFAITEKIFPTVTGDGIHSLEELIWRDPRARFVADKYFQRLGERRAEVLPAGISQKLVEAGNHAQGCIFQDGARLWTEDLERSIDAISTRLTGFYIGRYDIRYESESTLRAGKDFQIIELNGAASEATSIYDSRNSLVAAYRTLFQQWELVFAIGAANRQRGATTTRPTELWHTWRATNAQIATYPPAD